MTWTVNRTGMGTAQYSAVEVIEGGVLKCYLWRQTNLGGYGNVVAAYYGPGMWITAKDDNA